MQDKAEKHLSKKVRRIGAAPFEGYQEIRKQELEELKKLTLKESIRQTEMLLREVDKWMR